jgi:hypothetical protein
MVEDSPEILFTMIEHLRHFDRLRFGEAPTNFAETADAGRSPIQPHPTPVWASFQETSNPVADDFTGCLGWNYPFQQAKISINRDILVGNLNGAVDWRANPTHFCSKGKGKGISLPAPSLLRKFYRASDTLKQIVE